MVEEETATINVTRMMVLDVTGIADQGLRAVALYAGSMGWNVRQKGPGKEVVLVARDGTTIALPPNTSVRRHFIASQLRQVVTHTETHRKPTLELIEAILRVVKVSRENEREIREITNVGYPPRKKLPEPTPIDSFRIDAPKNGQPKTVVPPPPEMLEPAEPEPAPMPVPATPPPGYRPAGPPTIVTREPFVGKFSRANTENPSNKITFSDGSVKYECVICGEMFGDPRAIGGHRIKHIRAGEATQATWTGQRHAAGREAKAVIQQIAKLVTPFVDLADQGQVERLRAEVVKLKAEVTEITEERDRLRDNLKALRELLGDAR